MVIDNGVVISIAIQHLKIYIVVSIETINNISSQSNNISLKRELVLQRTNQNSNRKRVAAARCWKICVSERRFVLVSLLIS